MVSRYIKRHVKGGQLEFADCRLSPLCGRLPSQVTTCMIRVVQGMAQSL